LTQKGTSENRACIVEIYQVIKQEKLHCSYKLSSVSIRGHTYPTLDWTNRERSSAASQADTILKDPDPNGISRNQEPIPNHAIRHPESEKSEGKKEAGTENKMRKKEEVESSPNACAASL
jgi:hypothetical protein